MQSNTLNFFEYVLFLLRIDEKIYRRIDLHIQGIDLHLFKMQGLKCTWPIIQERCAFYLHFYPKNIDKNIYLLNILLILNVIHGVCMEVDNWSLSFEFRIEIKIRVRRALSL